MNDPWWRVRVSSEMYEGKAIYRLYTNALGVRSPMDFFGNRCALSYFSTRSTHPPSVESEAPNCPPREGSRATEQGNSSDVLSHRVVSTDVPRVSIGYRVHQLMDETEEETHPPTDLQLQPDAVSQLDRVACESA